MSSQRCKTTNRLATSPVLYQNAKDIFSNLRLQRGKSMLAHMIKDAKECGGMGLAAECQHYQEEK